MRTMAEYLPEHPFFAGLTPDATALVVGCARNVHFTAGSRLFLAGEAADTFYVLRRGRVALEAHDPRRGTLLIDTLDAGDVVGWSWLVAPYLWTFDGVATTAVDAIALDGACLRAKCAADPALGYTLMQRVAHVMYQRLQETRIRLLDLYGSPS